MPVKPGYLLLAGVGAVILWSGIQGKSVTGVFRELIGGQNPNTAPSANTIQQEQVTNPSSLAFGYGTGLNAGVGTTIGGSGTGSGSSNLGSVSGASALQQYAFSLFSQYGWGTSQQQPLVNLWNGESGWNPTAQNPGSTAYGIAQFLDGTWSGVGCTKSSNAEVQIQCGLKYIKQRYGSPAMAWAAWQSRNPHWY